MRRNPLFKCNRTCRMCAYSFGNTCEVFEGITRNPRARALKCRAYEFVVTHIKRLCLAFFGNRKEKGND